MEIKELVLLTSPIETDPQRKEAQEKEHILLTKMTNSVVNYFTELTVKLDIVKCNTVDPLE